MHHQLQPSGNLPIYARNQVKAIAAILERK
jgi:hypothetical protein